MRTFVQAEYINVSIHPLHMHVCHLQILKSQSVIGELQSDLNTHPLYDDGNMEYLEGIRLPALFTRTR
jgi:hypothetical protein